MKKFAIKKSNMLAELSATYKSTIPFNERININQAQDVAELLRTVWDEENIEYIEEMVIVFLNRQNHVLGWAKVASGGTSSLLCDPKVIFSMALIHNASAIIVSHNHPSGLVTPSAEDKRLTDRLVEAGKLLEIKVLDHIIITPIHHYSFADNGLI